VEHPERCEDALMCYCAEGKAPVFAVIDGMGGQQHESADGTMVTGREAALMLRETLIEDLQHFPPNVDASPGGIAERSVTSALLRGHQRIRRELNDGDAFPSGHRVGAVATVVVVCENGKRLLTVQVGDTRGYLLSSGELIQLCPDEDNIEFFVRSGQITPEDGERISAILNSYNGVDEPPAEGTVTIAGSPYDLYIAWRWFLVGNAVLNIPPANIVINAIGVHPVDPIPQTSRIEIAPGDALLLCSDGLYKNLTDAEILDMLTHDDSGEADALGTAAFARSQTLLNRRSTQDDISLILARW
jgi:serine/threonine protein phosphatase PrpC